MKKGRVLLLAISLVMIIAVIKAQAYPARTGSEFDPLVTKSYVEEQIQILTQKIGSGAPIGNSSGEAPVSGAVDQQVLNNLRTDISDLMNLSIQAIT